MRPVRRAYTLIEMLVVMALTGFSLSTAAVVLHTMHRADRQLRSQLQDQQRLDQLAVRLRQDAHRALQAIPGEPAASGAQTMTLTFAGDHTITYSLDASRIGRVAQRPGELPHREAWPLTFLVGKSWSMDASNGRPRIQLRLMPRGAGTGRRSRGEAADELRIVATVGLAE